MYDLEGDTAYYWENYEKFRSYHEELDTPLIYLKEPVFGVWEPWENARDEYRIDDKEAFVGNDIDAFKGEYSNRTIIFYESIIGISRTLFVCVLLGFGSWIFNRDASVLVLQPLERMIERI